VVDVTTIASGAMTFGIKSAATDSSYLVAAVTSTKSGNTHYLYPSFLGSALDTALGTNDSVAVIAELSWTDTAQSPSTLGIARLGARVYQNVNRGGETVPVSPAAYTDIGTVTNSTTPTFTNISAAGNVAIIKITAGAGSGSYTYKIVLITTGVQAGAMAEVEVNLAASANPTVEIRNATTSGTTVDTVTGDSSNATTYHFEGRFNGTAWEKWEGEYEL
jgi:hypothetical protein